MQPALKESEAGPTNTLAKPLLLDVRGLRTVWETAGEAVVAVDGLSLQVPHGQTVALVGESGCGKSITALSIMRLIPQPPGRIVAGRISFAPTPDVAAIDLLTLDDRRMRRLRGGHLAMVFQNPMTSLNPVMTVGNQIVEAIELHQPLRGREARGRAIELLRQVGIASPEERIHDYPHHLSGGMRQRVMIAMAFSCQPALLIADEPTTALDVTLQRQVLKLLQTHQRRTGMGILLITHDFGLVAQVADYVYVMYAGRIVEHACVGELFANPLHPYTQGLMRCAVRLGDRKQRLEVIPGRVPPAGCVPSGCSFHPRCTLTRAHAHLGRRALRSNIIVQENEVLRRCVETYGDEPSGVPALREFGKDHFAACWEVQG